jgi:hypothetical protein
MRPQKQYIDENCFWPLKMEKVYAIAVSFGKNVRNRGSKICYFEPREENERRIVNWTNSFNTSHNITVSDIVLESRIDKVNVRDIFLSMFGRKVCAPAANFFCVVYSILVRMYMIY